MKQYTYNIKKPEDIPACLFNEILLKNSENAKSVLVSIRLKDNDAQEYYRFYNTIKEYLPKAVIIGYTTYGSISEGLPENELNVISIFMMEKTQIITEYFDKSIATDEYENGRIIREKLGEDCKMVFFHVTADSVNVQRFTEGFMAKGPITSQIVGAGSGITEDDPKGIVAYDGDFYGTGIVAIGFVGEEFNVNVECLSGFVRISKELTATKTDETNIYELDNKPALDVYNDYLGFAEDKYFSDKCLAFPLVTVRDGMEIARVPVGKANENGLKFAAGVKEGEKYCISYVDNRLHNEKEKIALKKISAFQPEVILIYSCVSRKGLIKTDVGLETLLFEGIADTSGYFTHGEIIGSDNMIQHNNGVTIIVSLREGEKDKNKSVEDIIEIKENERDSLEGFHISALLKCISNGLDK